MAGVAVAALGATFAGLIARPGPPRTLTKSLAALRLGPLRLGRPLVRLVPDTVLLVTALWRRLARRQTVTGSFGSVPYRSDRALSSAAGRVVVEAWSSLAPNRYVIGVDDRAGVLIIHELVQTGDGQPAGEP